MSVSVERRLDRAIEEGEEVLRGQLGEPENEEAWADLADLVIGELADDYRWAATRIAILEREIEDLRSQVLACLPDGGS